MEQIVKTMVIGLYLLFILGVAIVIIILSINMLKERLKEKQDDKSIVENMKKLDDLIHQNKKK